MPDLSTILLFVTGLLTGAIVALRVIAPRTKTTVDDKILAGAEKVESVLEDLVHASPAPAK